MTIDEIRDMLAKITPGTRRVGLDATEQHVLNLREENEKLRAEVERLRQYEFGCDCKCARCDGEALCSRCRE